MYIIIYLSEGKIDSFSVFSVEQEFNETKDRNEGDGWVRLKEGFNDHIAIFSTYLPDSEKDKEIMDHYWGKDELWEK